MGNPTRPGGEGHEGGGEPARAGRCALPHNGVEETNREANLFWEEHEDGRGEPDPSISENLVNVWRWVSIREPNKRGFP